MNMDESCASLEGFMGGLNLFSRGDRHCWVVSFCWYRAGDSAGHDARVAHFDISWLFLRSIKWKLVISLLDVMPLINVLSGVSIIG